MAARGTPKKQHSAPEYLERRKQERERRKSETGLRARLRSRNTIKVIFCPIILNAKHNLETKILILHMS